MRGRGGMRFFTGGLESMNFHVLPNKLYKAYQLRFAFCKTSIIDLVRHEFFYKDIRLRDKFMYAITSDLKLGIQIQPLK